jgi:2-keto-3-deoxy-L-rhamnonate aldolase RhmA
MRTNKLRELMSGPGPLVGVSVEQATEELVEFYGILGFKWIFIDAEHDGVSVRDCRSLARAADAVGMGSVVRVPENRAEVILGYADTGVSGIMAPHVRSAEEARALVAALRYPPLGKRGVASASRAANFGLTQSAKQYFLATDTHPVAFALMEDAEAYDAAEEIVAVEGLEVYCLGTGDLAASLGRPGEKDHPEVVQRVAKLAEAAARHGKLLEASVPDAAGLRDAAAVGAKFIFTSNIALLASAGRAFLRAAAEAFGQGRTL